MVSLIKNKMANATWVKRTAIHQILEAARSRNDNINAATKALNLGIIPSTAKHRQVANV